MAIKRTGGFSAKAERDEVEAAFGVGKGRFLLWLRGAIPPVILFSPAKNFRDPWVGHPRLNRMGLHVARILLSDCCAAVRRLLIGRPFDLEHLRTYRRDGILVIANALPEDQFRLIQDEARASVARSKRVCPPLDNDKRGLSAVETFDGGREHFDGGSLNRFLDVDVQRMPATAAFITSPWFVRLCEALSTWRIRAGDASVYWLRHGSEQSNHDIQKDCHKDTFHTTAKSWLFLETVTRDDGPLEYVPGSHRMTARRLRWEHRRAMAITSDVTMNPGGAFRVSDAELDELGHGRPVAYAVEANTLVIADTRGFHRRGAALERRERLHIFASLRPWPFALTPGKSLNLS